MKAWKCLIGLIAGITVIGFGSYAKDTTPMAPAVPDRIVAVQNVLNPDAIPTIPLVATCIMPDTPDSPPLAAVIGTQDAIEHETRAELAGGNYDKESVAASLTHHHYYVAAFHPDAHDAYDDHLAAAPALEDVIGNPRRDTQFNC